MRPTISAAEPPSQPRLKQVVGLGMVALGGLAIWPVCQSPLAELGYSWFAALLLLAVGLVVTSPQGRHSASRFFGWELGLGLLAATGLVGLGIQFDLAAVAALGWAVGLVGIAYWTWGPLSLWRAGVLVPWLAVLVFIVLVPIPQPWESQVFEILRRVLGIVSVATFQFLGIPAIQDMNEIWLWDRLLELEPSQTAPARVLGILTLAWSYLVLTRAPAWHAALVLLASVPLAILSLSLQIVAMGIWCGGDSQLLGSPVASRMFELGQVFVSLLLLIAIDWYFGRLIHRAEPMPMRELVSAGRASS